MSETPLIRARAALQRRDPHTAETQARQAIAAAPHSVEASLVLGQALHAQRRTDEALEAFRRAASLEPDRIDSLLPLAALLVLRGRHAEAESVYRRVLAKRPDDAEALTGLGIALSEQGRGAEAEDFLGRALGQRPDSPAAAYHLANRYETSHRLEEAHRTVDRGLATQPDDPGLNLIAAKLDRRHGRLDAALEHVQRALGHVESPSPMEKDLHFEAARLFDRLEDADRAIRHCTTGNRLAGELAAGTGIDISRYLGYIRAVRSFFASEDIDRWTPGPAPDPATAPVFLVGFPRSGTTLVGRALDCHSRISVMEESPVVPELKRELARRAGADPRVLAELDERMIQDLQRHYFEQVRSRSDVDPSAVLVDKHPLHLAEVGIIHRLFPGARYIHVVRHPYDCCLSAFMQDFTLNDGTANFLTLEWTANAYAEIMSLWEQYRQALDLPVHTVVYEELVEDFEGVMSGTLEFLGVPVEQEVTDPDSGQRGRDSRAHNPSYHQVTERVYRRSRYRWQRYHRTIEPVRSVLDPYVARYGYR